MKVPWNRYMISLSMKNRIVGGIPTDPKLIAGWIAANMPNVSADEAKKLAEKTAAELPAATEDAAKGMWTTFKRNDGGIYIEGRQVKAMFKEAANILRESLLKQEAAGRDKDAAKAAKSRFTNLRSKAAERLFVEDDVIPILRAGKRLEKPDGDEEKPIHVMTAQGPRDALKRFDYVNAPAEIRFTVRFLDDGIVDLDLIKTLLEFSGWNGLGADRSQGNGCFEVAEIKAL